RTFIIAGLVIALLIGVVAVFFASGAPDGLESTALVIQGEKTLTGDTPEDAGIAEDHTARESSYSSPMPDYSLGEKLGPYGSVMAIIAGTLLAFLAAFGIPRAMRIFSRPKKEQTKP
ncbi:MAG: PDGLE domain-containing protein, partial [Methanomicrobiales archaeon]|nr:PDGLE domain-containing protein [Methanomicrobiales archaeon]